MNAPAEAVVLDLETTGLSPRHDAIVEIGALRIREGEVQREVFHTLINPERPIPERAARVHGIRNDTVQGAPTLGEVLPALRDFLGERAVVAHNVGFDCGFLRVAFERCGLLWQPAAEICTVKLSRRAYPGERVHRLDALAGRLGLEFAPGGRHRSMGDVEVTAQAYLRLLARLG